MDSDIDLASSAVDYLNRFNMRIKLFPLAAPVGTNLFLPGYSPTFRCLGPADGLAHKRQCTIDVPLVESRVDLGYEPLRVCHTVLRVVDHSSLHDHDRSRHTRSASPIPPKTRRGHARETPSPRDRCVFPARERTRRAVRAEQRNAHHLAGAVLDRLRA